MLVTATELAAGVALDLALGDPQWLPHPVRAIGLLATACERLFRASRLPLRIAGVAFWIVVVAIATAVVFFTPRLNIYWIYSLLACRDLDIEAGRVIHSLAQNDLPAARQWLSWIVGRDTATLSEHEIVRATIETVAENLNDGVIAPLFYLALGGPAGMAAYKAINTLDSMVGHKNERYRDFGWASARIDDAANYIPARVTAMLVWIAALLPGFDARRAITTTLRDGLNAEAAFAGALQVQLGGMNTYAGVPRPTPLLGEPLRALDRALYPRTRVLLYASEALWVAIILGCTQWL